MGENSLATKGVVRCMGRPRNGGRKQTSRMALGVAGMNFEMLQKSIAREVSPTLGRVLGQRTLQAR